MKRLRLRTGAPAASSEDDLRAAVMATIDGILVIADDGTVHFANPAAESLLGWRSGELVGSTFGLPLAPRGNVAELDVVRRNGSQVAIEMHIGPVTWESGAARVVTLRDVTGRKRVERELRTSEERYALSARGANDGLWDWDLVTGNLYTSPRWREILGLGAEEPSSDPAQWLGRVHPDDAESLQEVIREHLRGNTPRFSHEHRLRRRDGSYAPVLARGVAVHDDGAPVRFAGSITDLTGWQELIHQALHDGLTGLANRALFVEHLRAALGRVGRLRGDYRVAVLFLDLDRFKLVNDSLGHAAGDALLVTVGNRITACLRSNDIGARIGGDEFAVLLDSAQSFQAVLAATRRIQNEIARPIEIKGEHVYSSASIGIVFGNGQHNDGEAALRDADIAMYRAKAKGPGNLEIFEPRMYREARDRLNLHTELRGAVERSEFEVHYQPIVDMTDGRITGFEALLRWRHPSKGVLDAESFIDAAEETGALVPTGWRTLATACRQAKEWLGIAGRLRVSVNVSDRQFSQPDFPDRVGRALGEAGVEGSAVELEITERVIVQDYELATIHLEQCRALGVEVLIDDFGTGRSSLTALHRLPIDTVKIDRSFVSRLDAGGDTAGVVEAIVALARSLRMSVIAEGVETPEQRTRLLSLGCTSGQGFLFGRARDAYEATRILERGSCGPFD